MDERQSLKRMFAHDWPIHMHAAFLAGGALDQGSGIDDSELIAILQDFDTFGRSDRHDRKDCTFGLPALRAAAGVIVGDIALDPHLHGIAGALADERPACESSVSRPKA
jgi:hypothetical protein